MSGIRAFFTDTKRIQSRGAYRIILEVPMEMQSEVHNVLGWPDNEGRVEVAVARIKTDVPPYLQDKTEE